MTFVLSLLSIIMIDLVLSGDNAVVIAMATMHLPEHLRRKAMLGGVLCAASLRIILTTIAAWLLKIPLVQALGGIALIYIALKLLRENSEEEEINAGTSFWEAVRTIVVADLVMSLDNVLAVGGASKGNMTLMVLGLLISMAIIMWGSTLIAKLMERVPSFIYVGAGILIWTAGKMMVDDQFILRHLHLPHLLSLAMPLLLMTLILGMNFLGRGAHRLGKSDQQAGS